ncbi:MAG: hypothetical protein WC136_01245 [Sphaerochaeta sp.]
MKNSNIVLNIINRVKDSDLDWNIPDNKGFKHMPERNGPCQWIYNDLGVNYKNEVIFCSWFDMNGDTKIGDTDTPISQLIQKHNFYIELQKKNIFSNICASCGGYEP